MSKDSHDLAKDIGKQTSDVSKTIWRNRYTRNLLAKGARNAWKIFRFFIQKVLMTVLKSLLYFLGPWGILILTIMILLLLVIDSISVFDIHQEAAERTKAEVLFDETVKEVIQLRSQNAANQVLSLLKGNQNKEPYPNISNSWLQQTSEMLEPSWAVPAILYYYKNLKNESYRPWHEDYKNEDVSTPEKRRKVKRKFAAIINQKYDYYFNNQNYQLVPTYKDAPREYKIVRLEKMCSREDIDKKGNKKNVNIPTISTTKEVDYPSRKVVSSVQLFYKIITFQYKTYETDWIDAGTSTSGNCTIHKYEKHHLYILDDSKPPQREFDSTTLVSFLVATAPEGFVSKRVFPRDLEYVIELAKQIDSYFPSLNIDFDKFVQCSKKGSIESCIGQYVLGGNLGPGDMWYPAQYKEIYEKAAEAYGVDWWIIASLHGQETTYGTNPAATNPNLSSSAGALGHFQFMPLTWIGWGFKGDSSHQITPAGNILGPLDFILDLSNIKKYGGYGVDADHDGKASPWDLMDSAFTAAKYLKANGYVKGNEDSIKKAIFAYNHSIQYVNEVWNRGIMFRDGPVGGVADIPIASGKFTYPTTGRITSGFGMRNGEFHNGIDIGGGGRNYNVPVVSVADGIVSRSYFSSSYGWVVFVKHRIDNVDFESVYAHLSQKPFVEQGQRVKKGETLGYMGSTGEANGKHLHFELHSPSWNINKTNKLNPLLYIPVPPEQ